MCNFIFFKSFIRALKSFFFSVICWSAVGLIGEASSGCHVAFLTLVCARLTHLAATIGIGSVCTGNPICSTHVGKVHLPLPSFHNPGHEQPDRNLDADADRFFFTRRRFSRIYGRAILICAEFFLWFYDSMNMTQKPKGNRPIPCTVTMMLLSQSYYLSRLRVKIESPVC